MGCKLKYTNAKELEQAVALYFKDCAGHALTDADGNIIMDKSGQPILIDAHPPTVTGLALALGFKTRQSLLDYQARSNAFNDVLTIAKSRCEEYAERRLYDRDGVNGAKFSLANNFKGWRENRLNQEEESRKGALILDDV